MSVSKLELEISVALLPVASVSAQNLIDNCAFMKDGFSFVGRDLAVAQCFDDTYSTVVIRQPVELEEIK